MKKKLFTLLLLTISLSVHAQHFIKDAAFRQKVEAAWKQKMDLIGWKYWEDKGQKATPEEEEALKFLYAYMPIADATDSRMYRLLSAHKKRLHGVNRFQSCCSGTLFCRCV